MSTTPRKTKRLKTIHNDDTEREEPDELLAATAPASVDSGAQYNLEATAELLADAEDTPRPATRSKHAHTSSGPFGASRRSFGSVTATSSSTSVSGAASSPRKLLAELNVGDHAIDAHPLSLANAHAHRLPVPLVALLEDLEDVATGRPVVSAALQPDFDRLVAHRSVRRRPDTIYAPTPERDAVGPCPPLDDVLALLAEAERCDDRKQSEAGWNAAVHFPLLRLAVHGQSARKSQLVDVEICTTAGIIKEYHCVRSSTSKKVDMVMTIEPTADETDSTEAVKRIDVLRTRSPCFSINHTDFEPLLRSPIAISIETKHPSASGEGAALQVGVWQAAQWSLLQSLTQSQPTSCSSTALPAFLPAITVVGHDWTLAATTRLGQKTTLWTDCPIGHTRNIIGIYRIIWAIQQLANWARDDYWPWYKTEVLGIRTPSPKTRGS